jgi:hypothetical protein
VYVPLFFDIDDAGNDFPFYSIFTAGKRFGDCTPTKTE